MHDNKYDNVKDEMGKNYMYDKHPHTMEDPYKGMDMNDMQYCPMMHMQKSKPMMSGCPMMQKNMMSQGMMHHYMPYQDPMMCHNSMPYHHNIADKMSPICPMHQMSMYQMPMQHIPAMYPLQEDEMALKNWYEEFESDDLYSESSEDYDDNNSQRMLKKGYKKKYNKHFYNHKYMNPMFYWPPFYFFNPYRKEEYYQEED